MTDPSRPNDASPVPEGQVPVDAATRPEAPMRPQPAAPPEAPPAAQFQAKLRRPEYLRIGVVAAAAVVLLVSAAVALGASPAPSSGGSPNIKPNAGPGFGQRLGPGPGLGRLGPLARRMGVGPITIVSIDGANVSLKTADGWSRTITVPSATTIQKGGQKSSLGDLKVGDTVRFNETRNSDGTFTITELDVVLPRVAGSVTAVSDSGFTLKERGGTSRNITVNGATVYRLDATKAGSKSDVKVGSNVVVEGNQASDGSIAATAVQIILPSVAGQVTAKTADTITVTRPNGSTLTIHVGAGTVYRVRGVATPTLSDVSVGMVVVAEGTQNSDGSFQAVAIAAGPKGPRALRQPGP
jgi:Domain of unknown function (DUF5666)